MVSVLKQVGTVSSESEMLMMSVMTSACWLSHIFSTQDVIRSSSLPYVHSQQDK